MQTQETVSEVVFVPGENKTAHMTDKSPSEKKSEGCDQIYCSHHPLHLPGAAGTVPHQPGVIHVFVRHLGFVTVVVVEVVALLTLDQLVAH